MKSDSDQYHIAFNMIKSEEYFIYLALELHGLTSNMLIILITFCLLVRPNKLKTQGTKDITGYLKTGYG